MSRHRLIATQRIDRPVDDVFPFFAEPRNLARITPPGMRIAFLTDDMAMRKDLDIDYRLRPLPGLPARWRTRITDYDPPHGFTDVQLRGPYRQWGHRHTFTAVEGGTLGREQLDSASAGTSSAEYVQLKLADQRAAVDVWSPV